MGHFTQTQNKNEWTHYFPWCLPSHNVPAFLWNVTLYTSIISDARFAFDQNGQRLIEWIIYSVRMAKRTVHFLFILHRRKLHVTYIYLCASQCFRGRCLGRLIHRSEVFVAIADHHLHMPVCFAGQCITLTCTVLSHLAFHLASLLKQN